MSFDIFLQGFRNGDYARGDAEAMMSVLAPLVVDQGDGWLRIETSDGGKADVYGADRGSLMVNHASGRVVWDVIFELAVAGGLVVMPVGCGTCVVDEAIIVHLPKEAPTPVVVVGSGADILAAVTSA